MNFDLSELNTLSADLTKAGEGAHDGAHAVVSKGALNIKNESRQTISGLAHAPLYPLSIGYDLTVDIRANVEAAIGPDKNKPQGPLGNILEYGTVNNPPHAHLGPALDREGPNFEKAIADLAGDIL